MSSSRMTFIVRLTILSPLSRHVPNCRMRTTLRLPRVPRLDQIRLHHQRTAQHTYMSM
jgi:hypothetical protein